MGSVTESSWAAVGLRYVMLAPEEDEAPWNCCARVLAISTSSGVG
jgi:hypothetical protein